MRRIWIRKAPIVVGLVTLGLFVFSGVVMLLWNNILPVVLHISAITFWQAMGILLLCKLLFGGFRGRHSMRGHHAWKKQMFGKWQDMTPEEKEMFANRMKGCCSQYH